MSNRVDFSATITFTVLGFVIAALSLLVTQRGESAVSENWFLWLIGGLSFAAIFLVLLVLHSPKWIRRDGGSGWIFGLIVLAMVAVGVYVGNAIKQTNARTAALEERLEQTENTLACELEEVRLQMESGI